MKYSVRLFTVAPKWAGIIDDCEIRMTLIKIYLGKLGYCYIELFLLPQLAIEIFKLGRFFFGLCPSSGSINLLFKLERWKDRSLALL